MRAWQLWPPLLNSLEIQPYWNHNDQQQNSKQSSREAFQDTKSVLIWSISKMKKGKTDWIEEEEEEKPSYADHAALLK